MVGGRTALELQGFAHYLSGSHRETHLYGTRKPPGWATKLELENRLVFHNADRLFRQAANRPLRRSGSHHRNDLFKSSYIQYPWGQWEWPLKMSSPERASLELLDEIPQRETFHQADVLMEGLRNLSPQRLHTLPVTCRSIKVKRLFLWFAERHQHAWLKRLDRKDVDLGHACLGENSLVVLPVHTMCTIYTFGARAPESQVTRFANRRSGLVYPSCPLSPKGSNVYMWECIRSEASSSAVCALSNMRGNDGG